MSPAAQVPVVGQGNRRLYAAGALCALFGLMMILQTQSPGDGTWFWYAEFLRNGHRLYSGMHLALQPLYVLETSEWMALVGKGWLVGKAPATLHILAFVLALVLLIRQADLTPRWRATVLLCAFITSISFEAYRFDDYHVLADCLQLYSILALMRMKREHSLRAALALSVFLGILSGLDITCRLNDGCALFFAVLIALLVLATGQRLRAALLFCVAAGLTAAVIVALTGDTYHDYFTYSVLKAAGSKGGAGSVLAYPFKLPLNAVVWMWSHRGDKVLFFLILSTLVWGSLIARLSRPHGRREKWLALFGVVLLVVFARHTFSLFAEPRVLFNLSGIVVVLAYLLALWMLMRLLVPRLRNRRFGAWDPRLILFLIPLGQLASGSMSSGGSHLSLYPPLVLMLLLSAVVPPFPRPVPWLRDSLTAAFFLLFVSTTLVRILVPYSWITYREQPLFAGRTIFHHPLYGPMVIDRDLLQMIQPVCSHISENHIGGIGGEQQLLSLPFSYANYFCGVTPWRGYVQTYFDTTSAATIQQLMQQLDQSPPTWVFYQRQLNALALNEGIFNRGQPLEHRRLDELIQRKISSGAWHVVYTSDFGNNVRWDNHWFLINTR